MPTLSAKLSHVYRLSSFKRSLTFSIWNLLVTSIGFPLRSSSEVSSMSVKNTLTTHNVLNLTADPRQASNKFSWTLFPFSLSSIRHFGGGLPPPDLLPPISTIRSAEKYLPNNYLKLPPK